MKIGVIGIGNIAEKAYLPTYAAHQGTLDFYFATRNEETLQRISARYGFTHLYHTIDELLEQKIEACMIHAATSAHYTLAKKCLEQGIHVFIDKPLSVNLQEIEELQALAEEKNVLLMVGFNRRFAPMVESLKSLPDKRVFTLEKNRIAAKETTEFVIYDLFLHLVDTAVYLLDDPIIHIKSRIREKDGYLEWAFLHLETKDHAAIVTMDLNSGANTENYQVTAKQGTYRLENLVHLEQKNPEGTNVIEFGDWETTLVKRGFEPMVEAFFEQIQGKQDLEALRQKNIYLSHKICEQMLREYERHQF
ncbi:MULTISPECIES: Gfo/Idh/MocA family protein [unclassified Enterococcus]|jgi:virulence factor|uniref:Gfo/Idh/MocA family protein n=1 Tax=unclassified Enterococcus TaxID=2608891 RepID=UPI003D272C68